MMRKCSKCKGLMKERDSKTPDGVRYRYFSCQKCGDEILDMTQLRQVALKYRQIKQTKLSRWGSSLGVRIPKELVTRYRLKDNLDVIIIPEEDGLRIVPAELS
jgi:hypothetical protein